MATQEVTQEKASRGRPVEYAYDEYADHVIESLKLQDEGVGLSKSDLVNSFEPPLETGTWNSLVRRMLQAGQIIREGDRRGAEYFLTKPKAKSSRKRKEKPKTENKTKVA